jgi:hypothetical protein
VSKYWLERYWDTLQRLVDNPTHIRLLRFLKTDLNRFCTEPTILTIETDSNLQKFITPRILIGKKWIKTHWKGIEKIHNFRVGGLHRFCVNVFLKMIWNRFCTNNETDNRQIAASKIHNSQNIQPKSVNKYSLERYWKDLQCLFWWNTQIRSLKHSKCNRSAAAWCFNTATRIWEDGNNSPNNRPKNWINRTEVKEVN